MQLCQPEHHLPRLKTVCIDSTRHRQCIQTTWYSFPPCQWEFDGRLWWLMLPSCQINMMWSSSTTCNLGSWCWWIYVRSCSRDTGQILIGCNDFRNMELFICISWQYSYERSCLEINPSLISVKYETTACSQLANLCIKTRNHPFSPGNGWHKLMLLNSGSCMD